MGQEYTKRSKMRPQFIISVARSLFMARVFKKNRPLFVSWAITNRCNGQCLYCRIWENSSQELPTAKCLSLIEEIASEGGKIINFTGGEPLLREDIGELVDFIHSKGLQATVNSNGSLFTEKVKELKNLSSLKLSLDGPQEIHDFIRGKGSFDKVMQAIDTAKTENLKFSLCTVLSRYNLAYIEQIIGLAKNLNTTVSFQPAIETYLGSREINEVFSDGRSYRQAINRLIKIKTKTKDSIFIYNSESGLKHLYNWPDSNSRMSCAGGIIFCRIESDGSMRLCARSRQKNSGNIEGGFRKAFNSLKPDSCGSCWCVGVIEANYLFSFNPDVLLNLFKIEMARR